MPSGRYNDNNDEKTSALVSQLIIKIVGSARNDGKMMLLIIIFDHWIVSGNASTYFSLSFN